MKFKNRLQKKLKNRLQKNLMKILLKNFKIKLQNNTLKILTNLIIKLLYHHLPFQCIPPLGNNTVTLLYQLFHSICHLKSTILFMRMINTMFMERKNRLINIFITLMALKIIPNNLMLLNLSILFKVMQKCNQ